MISAVLTDIEGTTSSLSFVKDVLFPYARAQIGTFIRDHQDEPEVVRLVNDTRAEAGDPEMDLATVTSTLERWIDEDRKATPLKALQGLIWEAGYREGAFRGHIYPDAAAALRRWKAEGLKLYVYSSGSVYAQKLLFAHTAYGDLTPLFSDYFDTRIGAKGEADSYRRIAAELGMPADRILFLSDVENELNAARTAGIKTLWLVREAELDPAPAHHQVQDFSQIEPQVI
ncbi:MAG: acireductone synthase [Chromatiaceae bacterium]